MIETTDNHNYQEESHGRMYFHVKGLTLGGKHIDMNDCSLVCGL